MRFVIGGQIDKDKLAQTVQSLAGDKATSVVIMGDIEAAMAIKTGTADYYLGACNTGGGGALAMAIAIAGNDKCVTLGMPGKILSDAEIIDHVNNGKVAFGFTGQDIDAIVPVLLKAIFNK